MSFDIEHKQKTLFCCGFPCASSDLLLEQMTSHILNKGTPLIHCLTGLLKAHQNYDCLAFLIGSSELFLRPAQTDNDVDMCEYLDYYFFSFHF